MREESLELLKKLNALDAKALQDLHELVDILLLRNSGEMVTRGGTAKLNGIAKLFRFTYKDLKAFLLGTETTLKSPVVEIKNILAMADFYLMVWRFFRQSSFHVPTTAFQPFTFHLMAGNVRIRMTTATGVKDFPLTKGRIFQNFSAQNLRCSFEAGSQVLFYDFPLFRDARRKIRRFYRFQPVGPLFSRQPCSQPATFQ
ncbi:MAG: hypothetical protein HY644_09410 [Acidobacteria bacterium]|nr:hypothetical protein [Acidobacteriota bacterium]